MKEPKKRGRPRKFDKPEDLFQAFQDYRKNVENNPFLVHDFKGKDVESVMIKKQRPLTIEGFENYCFEKNIIRDLGDYMSDKNGRYGEFSTICANIKRFIRQHQIEGGLAGIYNASITQRLNNLAEKTEVESKVEIVEVFEIGGKTFKF